MSFESGRILIVLGVTGSVLGACNALLGNEEISYVDGEAGAPVRDGSRDGSTDGLELIDGEADGSLDGEVVVAPDASIPCDAAAFCSDFDPPADVTPFGWSSASPANPDAGQRRRDAPRGALRSFAGERDSRRHQRGWSRDALLRLQFDRRPGRVGQEVARRHPRRERLGYEALLDRHRDDA